MFKTGLLVILSLTVGCLVLGAAEANSDLTYAYYDARGASNYMAVNVTTTSNCIVKPAGEDIFFYDHLDAVVTGTDPVKIKPVATTVDNHNIDIKVDIGPFCEPMDVSLSLFVPVVSPEDMWFLGSENTLSALSDEAVGEGQSGSAASANNSQQENHDSGPGQPGPHKKFKNRIFWKTKVLDVSQDFKGQVPSGLYVLTLSATPASGGHDNFYRWVTLFIIP